MSKLTKRAALSMTAFGLIVLGGGTAFGQSSATPSDPLSDVLKQHEKAVAKFEQQFIESARALASNPAPKDAHDLQGVWRGVVAMPDPSDGSELNGVRGAWRPVTVTGLSRAQAMQILPVTPLAMRIRERRIAAIKAGEPEADSMDTCRPFGIPRAMSTAQIMQVDQAPGIIIMMWGVEMNRRLIHVDNKPVPSDEPASYMGYSRGHWDGNTLIVDTDHLNDKTLLDAESLSHGPKLKVHEEITKFTDKYGGVDLRDLITISDPDYFTRPFTSEKLFIWSPKSEIREYSCEESRHIYEADGKQVAE
jgi:hypothetical protein